MKLTFRKKGKSIEALDETGRIIGKFKEVNGDWEFTSAGEVMPPGDIAEQFVAYMTPPVEESPAIAPKRPPQGAVSGTTDLFFMAWAAEHMSDDEFRTTYAARKDKPSFLPWIEKQGIPLFVKRFQSL